MKFLSMLLNRKSVVVFTTLVVLLTGFTSFSLIKQELLPELNFKGANFSLTSIGYSTVDLEDHITADLEEEIISLDNVDAVQSETSDNLVSFEVVFYEDDINTFNAIENLLENSVQSESRILGYSSEFYSTSSEYEMTISIGSQDEDLAAMLQDHIYPRLTSLEEVREIDYLGEDTYEYSLDFDLDQLNDLGIDPNEVITQLGLTDTRDVLGTIENSTVFRDTAFASEEEVLESTFVTAGESVELEEIANFQRRSTPNFNDVWKQGYEDSILLMISREDAYSTRAFAAAVEEELASIQNDDISGNIDMQTIINQSDYIDSTINDLLKNVAIGGLLALLAMVVLTRNFRQILTIGINILISLSVTFLIMWVTGISINLLTLIGLGLGISIMIDSIIVVVESIQRNILAGKKREEGVIQGLKEVIMPIFASVMSTIVVFLPIGLLDDEIGEYIFALSITVVIALLSSLVISAFITPVLADLFLKKSHSMESESKIYKKSKVLKIYQSVLGWILRKERRIFAAIASFAVVSFIGFFLISNLPINLMPDLLDRQSQMSLIFDDEVSDQEKEEQIEAINESLSNVTDVEQVLIWQLDRDFLRLHVDMSKEDVTRSQAAVTNDLVNNLRDLQTENTFIEEIAIDDENQSTFVPIELHLTGEDLNELASHSDELINQLEELEGLTDITHSLESQEEQFEVMFDETALADLQLTEIGIMENIDLLINEAYAGEISINNEAYPLAFGVQNDMENVDDFLNETMDFGMENEDYSLGDFIELSSVTYPGELLRNDSQRYVKISANANVPLHEINNDITNIINDFNNDLSSSYNLEAAGVMLEQEETYIDYLLVLLIAIGLAFVIVSFQLKSLAYSLMIFSIIPFTLIGGILGLFITNNELNVLSAIGFIILVGIVLNNSILLIDRLNYYKGWRISINERILKSVGDRWKPIILTTATTILGMLPLALAGGNSSNYQSPLAVVVIFGLVFSTFITLLLVPSLYNLIEKFRDRKVSKKS